VLRLRSFGGPFKTAAHRASSRRCSGEALSVSPGLVETSDPEVGDWTGECARRGARPSRRQPTCCGILGRRTQHLAVFARKPLNGAPATATLGDLHSDPFSPRLRQLDLGTTKVCCAVADLRAPVSSAGRRMVASRGVRKGAVRRDRPGCRGGPRRSTWRADVGRCHRLGRGSGSLGGHITSQNSRGRRGVEAGHREVRDQDVHRATDAARA